MSHFFESDNSIGHANFSRLTVSLSAFLCAIAARLYVTDVLRMVERRVNACIDA